MSLNLRTTFLLFWHKVRCIVLNKKQKLFVKKNANHTISIYGKRMTSIFLMAKTKILLSTFEIAPKNFFVFFFNRKLIFVLKQTFFEKKTLHAKFNFLCV